MSSNEIASPGPERRSRNSAQEIVKRAGLAQISWLTTFAVVCGRTVFVIVAQAMVAGVYALKGYVSAWNAAAPWWSVYGTLADVGCLVLVGALIRAEGIGFRDLIGAIRWGRGRDVLMGIGLFLSIYPFFLLAAPISSRLVWGRWQPYLYPGLLAGRTLPVWAIIYSLSLWWIFWSATEELTYQGYALPRIEVLGGQWTAVLVVSFWWALQHSFIPLILDWHYIVWRFLAFWPGVVVFTLVYLRLRRLAPLIVAHWLMDISAMFITLTL